MGCEGTLASDDRREARAEADDQQDDDGTPRPPHPDADPATTPDVHGDPETPI
jgi:hypothetical protein